MSIVGAVGEEESHNIVGEKDVVIVVVEKEENTVCHRGRWARTRVSSVERGLRLSSWTRTTMLSASGARMRMMTLPALWAT